MSQRVISFHYTLTDKSGKVIDASKERGPLSFMEGSGQIIPGLEKQLANLNVGDKRKIQVPAAEAYGERNEQMVVKVEPSQLPKADVKPGDRFSGGPEPHAPIFIVTSVTATEVTLDGNHSLAGVDLIFDVELTSVREATEEELSHGHAHGEHGHSH
jgi:FKBP-type peptidyl-prolyl cis-trans isomerase SlyD